VSSCVDLPWPIYRVMYGPSGTAKASGTSCFNRLRGLILIRRFSSNALWSPIDAFMVQLRQGCWIARAFKPTARLPSRACPKDRNASDVRRPQTLFLQVMHPRIKLLPRNLGALCHLCHRRPNRHDNLDLVINAPESPPLQAKNLTTHRRPRKRHGVTDVFRDVY
jgi:hypothetical protein